MRLKVKSLESPNGYGDIWQDGARIANVMWALKVTQVVEVVEVISGSEEEVPGQIYIEGNTQVIGNELLDLSGRVFTLHLMDKQNRCLELSCYGGDPISKRWTVKAAPPGGFTTC